jgi:chromosome segregation ATPase
VTSDSEAIALGLASDDEFDAFSPGGALEVMAHTAGVASETSVSRARDYPTGRTPGLGELRIDPVEVAITADFGPAPSAWYMSPAYAVRVHVRRRALGAAVPGLERALARAEQQRDELLRDTLRAMRPRLEAEDRYRRLLDRAREAEALASSRGQEMRRASAEYGARSDDLGRQRQELGTKLGERQRVRQERAGVLSQREQDYGRAEARLKRIEIEIRNARAAIGQAGSAELGARLESLEQAREQTVPEVETRRGEMQAQAREVAEMDGQIGQLERELRRLEAEQRALDQKTGKELGTRSAAVSDAEAEERGAWADAARAMLAQGEPGWLDEAAISAVRMQDQAVERAATELAKHLQAVDAFDRTVLARGHRVTLWGLALLVVLLVIAKWL